MDISVRMLCDKKKRILHILAFVRCGTEKRKGPQERALYLELMHSGRVHTNATRKFLVIPKI